jgi:hypothetical protein
MSFVIYDLDSKVPGVHDGKLKTTNMMSSRSLESLKP